MKIKYYLSPLNGSNGFGTADYDTHIYTRIDYPITDVIKSITNQELKAVQQICEVERTHWPTILATFFQRAQLGG